MRTEQTRTQTSTQISTQIRVAAPVEAVAALLGDGPSWRDWTRALYFLDPLVPGQSVRMRVTTGPITAPIRVRVQVCDGGEVRWTGGPKGLFFGNHYLRWTADGDETIIEHGETFTGAMARPLFPVLRRLLTPLYEALNADIARALK